MNSSKTEQRAITAIRAEIDKYPQLKHQLNENDKTISWDGDIFVFKTAEQTKKDFLGKVPVQLKGTTVQDINTPTISFPLDVADLSNYQKEQGCILFVVCFSSDSSDKSQIYYAELLPAQLSQLLKETPAGQKTKNIRCQRLTQEPPDLEEICFSFIHNCNKQKGQLSQQVITMQQAHEAGFPTSISIYSKPEHLIENLFNRPHFAYASCRFYGNKPIELPINAVQHINSITIQSSLLVDDAPIATVVKTTTKKENPKIREISVSPSIGITVDLQKGQGKLHYKETGTLKERLKEVHILQTISKGNQIKVGGLQMLIQHLSPTLDAKFCQNRIAFFRSISSILAFCGIPETELDCNQLTEVDFNTVMALQDAINNPNHSLELKQPLKGKFVVNEITIANLHILLFFQHIKDKTYSITNFFSDSLPAKNFSFSRNGGTISVSRYSFLKQMHFERVSNISYDKMKLELCSQPFSLQYAEILTTNFLDMLHAYDKNHKPQLFEVLKTVNKYFLRHDSRNTSHIINKMQLIFRKRALNRKEQQQLQQIQNTTNNMIEKLAIAVLLQQPHIEQLYAKLSPEEQQAFNSWPIRNLWIKNP